MKISGETRLFWFETEVLYVFNRFWLVEWCIFWNGDKQICEMVEILGAINGYIIED